MIQIEFCFKRQFPFSKIEYDPSTVRRALIIFYSQAGQTEKAVTEFSRGLSRHLAVDIVRIEPREDYAFPWSLSRFFRVFPRAVGGVVPEIRPLALEWEKYDLVVIGYQVWFLSPSLPVQAFLQSHEAEALRDKTVVTLATCRNLWHSAFKIARERLLHLGSRFLGQITVCELSPVWASFITTPRWMLTGRKGPFAFFPPAGISDFEFSRLEASGERIGASWAKSATVPRAELKSNLDILSLRMMDRIGRNFFEVWTKGILSVSRHDGFWRDFLIFLFRFNLIILIICVVPVTKICEFLVRYWPFGSGGSSNAFGTATSSTGEGYP